MPITPDEIPALVGQTFKLKDAVENVVKALKQIQGPLTGAGICTALGIAPASPIYVLAETVDLVVKDLAT